MAKQKERPSSDEGEDVNEVAEEAAAPARDSFHVHIYLPNFQGREIMALMQRKHMKASEFFRSLYDQAKAVKLPITQETAK